MKTDEALCQIVNIMEEQLRWSRLAGLKDLRAILENEFKSNEEKLVYELSDGEKSIRDLEKDTRISRSKISLLWHKWYNIGIMEKSKKYEGKRMKKSFSFTDVGIEIEFPQGYVNNKKDGVDFND